MGGMYAGAAGVTGTGGSPGSAGATVPEFDASTSVELDDSGYALDGPRYRHGMPLHTLPEEGSEIAGAGSGPASARAKLSRKQSDSNLPPSSNFLYPKSRGHRRKRNKRNRRKRFMQRTL